MILTTEKAVEPPRILAKIQLDAAELLLLNRIITLVESRALPDDTGVTQSSEAYYFGRDAIETLGRKLRNEYRALDQTNPFTAARDYSALNYNAVTTMSIVDGRVIYVKGHDTRVQLAFSDGDVLWIKDADAKINTSVEQAE
jgi:hypothetical protein